MEAGRVYVDKYRKVDLEEQKEIERAVNEHEMVERDLEPGK